ncbi:MAG: WD40 repeat domain-containing protein, partial [Anaerolineaceae bacterium]|nr:WD40 repeat domain-containing protein [Anaerolineaceae bacterium]
TTFSGRVIGINQLPFQPYCIAGSASGELGLIDQTNTPTVRMIPSPTAGLTSLTVSPDGNYMATGYRKNRQTLWDLEVLKIPALLNQPIAFDHANTLNMINKFSGDLRLTEEVRNSLQFLKLLLQHRYRYDIDIVQTTGIVPGLFDIILDNQ